MTDHINASIEHRTAILTLNRPRALNALSLEMIRTIAGFLTAWRTDDAIDAVVIRSSMGRAFCAGGDIRYFHEVGTKTPRGGSASLEDFFTEEYALNHLIHYFPKPYIALMDGVVMGGGMGLSQGSPTWGMRIVTERTKMAMPEVNIGLFPDVGGSYFLPRARGRVGLYLALTGHVIGGADAVHAGLADLLVPFDMHPQLLQALTAAPVAAWRQTVAGFATPDAGTAGEHAGASTLAIHAAAIDRHFAHPDVAQIMASLAQDPTPFAQETWRSMQKRSPAMLGVTVEQLRRGAGLSVAACLRMERTMVRHCFRQGDVIEGIRAAVIDKDDAPQWEPALQSAVTPELVASYFAPVWPDAAHPLRHLD